jgi:cystathionine gamma-synthase
MPNDSDRKTERKSHPATLAAQGMGWIDETTRAIVPGIQPSSTFQRDADNQYRSGRNYARADNPTFDQPEAVLAALENGKAAMLFSSGMAAATSVFLSLHPGDHVVAPNVLYWSLRNWMLGFGTRWGLRFSFVDMTENDAIRAAVEKGRTKLIWTENPANPMWDVTDLAATAEIAQAAGARFAVDSTAATPVFIRPLDLGADIVMHSATKYLNGHSDIIAGALVTREKDEAWERIVTQRVQQGAVLGAFEAWLLTRGMRTLYPRVRTAAANAEKVAEHFVRHPRVLEVLYPGLPGFKNHRIAARQMTGGFGGMLSIRVRAGEEAAISTAANVRVWKRATSLGGVESLIEHRGSVEGPNSPCPQDLLRLSVGIEDANDLIEDLDQALQAN